MADHNDRDQGPDDLYDEAAPRSIFAATWFRAVLVLIVLGVIGAVAVPYILDAMNAPPGKLSASAPMPSEPPVVATGPTSPAPAAPPSAPPATAPTTPAPATSATATAPPSSPPTSDKPTEKPETTPAPTTPASETMKAESKAESATAPKAAATNTTRPAPRVAKATPAPPARTSARQWFVQVGAFKDSAAARRVAEKLREDKYTVVEWAPGGTAATVASATTPASGGTDRYDVIVTGQSPAELNERLAAKGLTAEATTSGTVVRPSLPLRDAVALSKDLAVDGLKVQVRRAGGTRATTRSTRATSGTGDRLHRVSVGGFADRPAAVAALKELEAKGYKPFLTRR